MASFVAHARSRQRRIQRQRDLELARTRDEDQLEESLRKQLAATLIAQRIIQDISDADLVKQLGSYDFADSIKRKRKAVRERLTYDEARRIERTLLTDGHLSTFQRYARLVGMKVNVGFGSDRAQRLRPRMSAQHLARHIRTQRRYLAATYSSARNKRPRRRYVA